VQVGDCPCSGLSSCEDDIGPLPGTCEAAGSSTELSLFTGCCGSNVFGACDGKYGTRQIRKCADDGEKVFQMYTYNSCEDYARRSGLYSDFPAGRWCEEGEDDCWIPYQLDANDNCFALDAEKSGWWSATGSGAMYGGTEVRIDPGTTSSATVSSAAALPSTNSHTGATLSVAFVVGVVGVGALWGRRAAKAKAAKADAAAKAAVVAIPDQTAVDIDDKPRVRRTSSGPTRRTSLKDIVTGSKTPSEGVYTEVGDEVEMAEMGGEA